MADATANPTTIANVSTAALLAELLSRVETVFIIGIQADDGTVIDEWSGVPLQVLGLVDYGKAKMLAELLPKPTLDEII
jgi:hypothetical protein